MIRESVWGGQLCGLINFMSSLQSTILGTERHVQIWMEIIITPAAVRRVSLVTRAPPILMRVPARLVRIARLAIAVSILTRAPV